MKAYLIKCFALLASLVIGSVFGSLPAAASGIDVFLGYADSSRSNQFFPTTWLGDPNVVSQSSPDQMFDASAIRIDNNSGAEITITDFSVTFRPALSPTVISFWAPLTIEPGQTGIFTQLDIGHEIDGSDYPLFGGVVNINEQFPLSGCSNPSSHAQADYCYANSPIVSFSVDEQSLTYVDKAHILDAFGDDSVTASSDRSENLSWNIVGGVPSQAGSATPEPSSMLLFSTGVAAVVFGRKRLWKR